jgi:glycosyltransferase involved in cell wall biosynthesis
MRIGIDASGILAGGGLTHLSGLLEGTAQAHFDIERITVWGTPVTLARLPSYPWLAKIAVGALDGSLLRRYRWQCFALDAIAREACDVLLVPSGSSFSHFHPLVAISQNMLPFQLRERLRFGFSLKLARLQALRFSQSATFRRADGVVFLSNFARNTVERTIGPLAGLQATIPHGVSDAFRRPPRAQLPLASYSPDRPFRWLYVSIIDAYKHSWNVAEATARLRGKHIPVDLTLVGGSSPGPLRRLRRVLTREDASGTFLHYQDFVPFDRLPDLYASADAFVFASSCENMPNILLEAMASGLPIASSNRGPMPEVLGNAGAYFDPEQPASIARAMERLMLDPALRQRCAAASFARAQTCTWEKCSRDTFAFLASVVRDHS